MPKWHAVNNRQTDRSVLFNDTLNWLVYKGRWQMNEIWEAERQWNDVTRGNRSPSASSSAAYSTCAGLGSSPGLRCKRPTTGNLSPGILANWDTFEFKILRWRCYIMGHITLRGEYSSASWNWNVVNRILSLAAVGRDFMDPSAWSSLRLCSGVEWEVHFGIKPQTQISSLTSPPPPPPPPAKKNQDSYTFMQDLMFSRQWMSRPRDRLEFEAV
jgi:hypothetical protein